MKSRNKINSTNFTLFLNGGRGDGVGGFCREKSFRGIHGIKENFLKCTNLRL